VVPDLAEMELLGLGQAEPEQIVGVGAGALVLLGIGHPAGLNVAALPQLNEYSVRRNQLSFLSLLSSPCKLKVNVTLIGKPIPKSTL
jgi:hypothetical protein